jgi:thymidylate synthase ThyX
MDIMFNWRSFHHFLELRMKPDAQLEVRELSEQMLELVRDIPGDPFKHTLEAFGYVVKSGEIFYHSV